MIKKKMPTASKIYVALIFLFLYAPIIVLILYSFNSTASTSVFTGFSLRWYKSLLHDEASLRSLYNTVILAVTSSAIATLLGSAAAVGINAIKNRHVRSSVMTVTNVPMMNPEIVTGVSMMLLFVFVGRLVGMKNVLGFQTMLIAHITFELPYVILNVMPKLRQTDPHLPEAAMDLGCGPVRAFFKAVLPDIVPGIVSGFIMSFTLSLDDFVISYFTQGPTFETLPIKIFSMTKKRIKPDMYALSVIVFAAVLIMLILVNVAQARSDKKQMKSSAKAKEID